MFYLLILVVVGLPLVLFGILGYRERKGNIDHFYSVLDEILGNTIKYKGRWVKVNELSEDGRGAPMLELVLSNPPQLPITKQLYFYLIQGIGISREGLTITCYRYTGRKISKDLMIRLLDKLSSVADEIEGARG